MQKKLMALILVVPLIFLLVIYSASRYSSLSVAVPANGIKITSWSDNGVLMLDLQEYKNDYRLTAEVMPAQAKNKDYTVQVESEASDASGRDVVSVDKDGYITAHRTGDATVSVTSNDGGFTKSLHVRVDSRGAGDIIVTARNANGDSIELSETDNGYTAETALGKVYFDAELVPSTVQGNDVIWECDAEGMKVDRISGETDIYFGGRYKVTVTSGDIIKTVNINASRADKESIAVNGMQDGISVAVGADVKETVLYIEHSAPISDKDIEGCEVKGIEELFAANGVYRYRAAIGIPEGEEVSVISIAGTEIRIAREDYVLEVMTRYDKDGDKSFYQKTGTSVTYSARLNVGGGSAKYSWELTPMWGDVSIEGAADGSYVSVKMSDEAYAFLDLKAVTEDGVEITYSAILEGVKSVTSVIFDENLYAQSTLKRRIAVGDMAYTAKGIEEAPYRLKARAYNASEQIDTNELLYISNEQFIGINGNEMTFTGSGTATVTAKWRYADYFGENISASITFDAVDRGVRVGSEQALRAVAESGYPVVLSASIELGHKGMTSQEKWAAVKQMPTTYDWTFYKNKGATAPPAVNYIIEFKGDVYGNGYEINAANITEPITDINDEIHPFNGPLDFVTVLEAAAVCAQDNISFLVRSNITIDNVVLKGCRDEDLYITDGDDVRFELNNLNKRGTTLEIASNARLVNSRVSNGRTAVRIFGGKSGSDGSPVVNSLLNPDVVAAERISVTIDNCVISNAREFLIKIGSNRALRSKGTASPAFTDANGAAYGNDFLNDKTLLAADDGSAEYEYFYDNYVLTDVTLGNSVLKTSGLFSICMETHFAGEALNGIDIGEKLGLKDLASTSYASVLRMKGEVRMYDWKQLSNIDSSTLIEAKPIAGEINETLKGLMSMDISAMLNIVAALNPGSYGTVISRGSGDKGEDMVHGGIAFYGGGKNYSRVDMSGFNGEVPNDYAVNIGILKVDESDMDKIAGLGYDDMTLGNLKLQGQFLPLAAGNSDFVFYMYGSNSAFDYAQQSKDFTDGSAYSWMKPEWMRSAQ